MINPVDIGTSMFNLQGKKLENLVQNTDSQSGKDTKDEQLKKAASDFEAVFLNQFMETLDSTVEKSDFMHGGQGESTFKSMLTQELSKNIASSPSSSFGLAAQIYKQLKDKV